MPAYCEKKRLISLPTPDTHETQLSNCSHTNLSKNCYVFASFFLFLWGDKYKKIFPKRRFLHPVAKPRSSPKQLIKLYVSIYRLKLWSLPGYSHLFPGDHFFLHSRSEE